jgi:CBS domain-containing protein
MNAEQIMTPQPVVATPDVPLQEIAELMVEYDCGEIPIVDTRETMQPIGVVTDRDITCRVVARGINPLVLTAKDCMSSPCLTIERMTDVGECCRLMEEHQVRRVLVVNRAGQLCGIISQADIAEFAGEQDAMGLVREVSQRSPGASSVDLPPPPK